MVSSGFILKQRKHIHRLHSVAWAAKQAQLSALPRRSLRLGGVPWGCPKHTTNYVIGRFCSSAS